MTTSVLIAVEPDGDDFAWRKVHVVHLCDKDGGDRFVQCSSIHVDRGSDRKHEPRDTLVDAQVLLQTTKRYRQSSGAEQQQQIRNDKLSKKNLLNVPYHYRPR